MQRIMQILHDDHINVARLLDLMENVLGEIRNGNLVRVDVARNAMRYMTAYPDLYHHPTEDVVFQQLLKRAPETQSKVEQLFDDHQALGVAGNALLDKLTRTIKQPAEPAQNLVRDGTDYVAQLRRHMNIEEGEIFPLAKVILSRGDWEMLDEAIATTGDPLFGEQVQKSYQDLARSLTEET